MGRWQNIQKNDEIFYTQSDVLLHKSGILLFQKNAKYGNILLYIQFFLYTDIYKNLIEKNSIVLLCIFYHKIDKGEVL